MEKDFLGYFIPSNNFSEVFENVSDISLSKDQPTILFGQNMPPKYLSEFVELPKLEIFFKDDNIHIKSLTSMPQQSFTIQFLTKVQGKNKPQKTEVEYKYIKSFEIAVPRLEFKLFPFQNHQDLFLDFQLSGYGLLSLPSIKDCLQKLGFSYVKSLKGEGAFGTVFEICEIKDANCKRAAKITSYSRQMKNEASIMKKMAENNIAPKLYGYYLKCDSKAIIIMDLYDMSLDSYLDKYRTITRDVFNQIQNLIQKMHQFQIYHKDLKTANIVLNVDKNTNTVQDVKIIDWGLAIDTSSKQMSDFELDDFLEDTRGLYQNYYSKFSHEIEKKINKATTFSQLDNIFLLYLENFVDVPKKQITEFNIETFVYNLGQDQIPKWVRNAIYNSESLNVYYKDYVLFSRSIYDYELSYTISDMVLESIRDKEDLLNNPLKDSINLWEEQKLYLDDSNAQNDCDIWLLVCKVNDIPYGGVFAFRNKNNPNDLMFQGIAKFAVPISYDIFNGDYMKEINYPKLNNILVPELEKLAKSLNVKRLTVHALRNQFKILKSFYGFTHVPLSEAKQKNISKACMIIEDTMFDTWMIKEL